MCILKTPDTSHKFCKFNLKSQTFIVLRHVCLPFTFTPSLLDVHKCLTDPTTFQSSFCEFKCHGALAPGSNVHCNCTVAFSSPGHRVAHFVGSHIKGFCLSCHPFLSVSHIWISTLCNFYSICDLSLNRVIRFTLFMRKLLSFVNSTKMKKDVVFKMKKVTKKYCKWLLYQCEYFL